MGEGDPPALRTGEGGPAAGEGRKRLLVAASLLFIAFNLRPAIAAVAPVLPEIRRSDGLSAPVAGLLTTLPLVCFGLLSPLAPALARRAGMRRLLLWCLGGITLGISLRSLPPIPTLFAGTAVLGASLAIVNVQMPAIVKSSFEVRTGLATGLYTTMIDLGIAVSAGVTVPLARALGGSWRLAMALWAVVALGAVALWAGVGRLTLTEPAPGPGRLPELTPVTRLSTEARVPGPSVSPAARRPPKVWTSRTAWWITAYMGLQSLNFFSVLAWLPTILRDRGLSAPAAGGVLSLVGIIAIPAALVAPVIANRRRILRLAIAASTAAIVLGLTGLLVEPHGLEALSAAALAIGQGSSLSLALVLMVVRAEDSAHALAISGMAQGVGYLVASSGPATLGAIEAATKGWSVPLTLLLGLAGAQLGAGWVAVTH